MKAPWILIWALAAVPVFAQEPCSNEDRGAAFDLILNFVDDARADELQASRDAVDAARDVLMALRIRRHPMTPPLPLRERIWIRCVVR